MTSTSRKNIVQGVATALGACLVPVGFALNPKTARFYLSGADSCIVVELQKSSKSTAHAAVIAVNIGIWSSTLAARCGGPSSAKGISAMDCHWWVRAGQLDEDMQGRWWTVSDRDDAEAVARDIWQSLSPAVALFTSLTNEAELLAYLLATQGPFLDPMNRWAFALALAGGLGNREAERRAAVELQSIGQSRTLPIGHKMLLQSVPL